jgi:hypothetical protein
LDDNDEENYDEESLYISFSQLSLSVVVVNMAVESPPQSPPPSPPPPQNGREPPPG